MVIVHRVEAASEDERGGTGKNLSSTKGRMGDG
jgi:hypothetical protein